MKSSDSLAPEALLPLLPAVYALAEPVTCDWLSSGLNDVFRVTAGGREYILKVYRAGWRSQAEVGEEIAALLHLDRKGVSVALPIARRDGTFAWTLDAPAGERQVVLFACAKGKEIDSLDEPCCRLMGAALADLHDAAGDFAGARVRYDLEQLLARPLRALEPFLEERPADRDFLHGLADRLRHRIESLPPGTLDWGYCHGDFRAANLRLDEATGRMTLFDFDLGGMGFRAYDLTHPQTILHPTARKLLWGASPREDSEACWTAFLRGYTERRPLRAAELEAIPQFVALQPLQIMRILLETSRQSRSQETGPASEGSRLPGGDFFDRVLQFLRAWDEAHL